MIVLQSSLYTAAITLCVFLARILKAKESQTEALPSYFLTFLHIEALGFVLELLVAHPAMPFKALSQGLLIATSFLIAPCLWLAVKERVEGTRPQISALRPGHLFLILVGMVLTLPLMETVHAGTDFSNPDRVVSVAHSYVIHSTMLLCILLFVVQVPFYLWRCAQLLSQEVDRKEKDAPVEGTTLNWLYLPLAIVFTTWLLSLLRGVFGAFSASRQEITLLCALIDVGVTAGAIYIIAKRVAFAAPGPLADTPAEITASKYSKSSLSASDRERIKHKLEVALGMEECYCDNLLSLSSLSRIVKEDAHYVSQVINQDLNTSFYELINHYRIEHAKKMLVAYPQRTVLEVAFSVGFNSKSTFYTAFRHGTGTTPHQYRSSHQQ